MRRLLTTTIAIGSFVLVGCGDSPTGPSSTEQSGNTSTPTATAPPAWTPPMVAPVPVGAYNITVRYIGATATARQQEAVAAAVAKWQAAIMGDLPDINAAAEADACFVGQPAVNERIDDILIFVEFKEIDGPGKILGEAGPCFIRNSGSLPLLGHLKLDQADLLQMERYGTLDAVVMHEIGHVLGIGTLWPAVSLIAGAGGADPRFTGIGAVGAYRTLGGADMHVPVEDTGAGGTRDGHWRESIFGNELMTGYISGSTNPLSAMTIASLTDMGYNTNQSAASSYSFATSTQRATASVNLHEGERMVTPRFLLDQNGRRTVIEGQRVTTPWRPR